MNTAVAQVPHLIYTCSALELLLASSIQQTTFSEQAVLRVWFCECVMLHCLIYICTN